MAVLAALAAPTKAPAGDVLASDDGGFTSIHFGLKGGLAITQHQGTEPRDMQYEVSSSTRRGLAAGVFWILPVTRRFALQQEVLYVQKGSRQVIGVQDAGGLEGVDAEFDVRYDMDYVEIPILTRYYWLLDGPVDVYSLGGFAFGMKVHDRYVLSGQLADDFGETVPARADSDMSEVDLFDFALTFGFGVEFPAGSGRLLLEYRFDLSVEALPMPTYATVPTFDGEETVENDPVPLRNQAHMVMVGFRF